MGCIASEIGMDLDVAVEHPLRKTREKMQREAKRSKKKLIN